MIPEEFLSNARGRNDTCNDLPTEALLAAMEAFNAGEWFDCHEILEELWVGTEGEVRDFYQGLLQLAVALHHWQNGNFGGAVTLLSSGSGLLRRVRHVCQHVDVTSLVASADILHKELIRLGRDHMGDIEESLLLKMRTAD